MSEHSIDGAPADTGENPLYAFLHREFARLHARISALETPPPPVSVAPPVSVPAPQANGNGNGAGAGAAPLVTVGASDAGDPLSLLGAVADDIAKSPPTDDPQIIGYRDRVKTAVTNLRTYFDTDTQTSLTDRIAYEMATRNEFSTVVGELLDAARSRDPYAPQLQIG